MIAKAKGQYFRLQPSKVKQVIDLIRGKDVITSTAILVHVNKGPTKSILKILNSALSNAKQKGLSENQLYVSRITADKGPMWKRFQSAAFGRATPLLKRTTHLTIELDLITK